MDKTSEFTVKAEEFEFELIEVSESELLGDSSGTMQTEYQ